MLTLKQSRFGFEYAKDYHGTKAAIRAGYSENSAYSIASELLKKPEILARIAEREAELAAMAELTPEWVLKQWRDIAIADPNEIISVRRNSCGDCYEQEIREVMLAAGMRDSLRVPNPECVSCHGEGIEEVFLADTRHLKGPARRLYAGVQKTKDGIKVLMRDQDAALANISKYLGMVVERKELSAPGGGPLLTGTVNVNELTDEQLAVFLGVKNELDGGTNGGTLTLEATNPIIQNEF